MNISPQMRLGPYEIIAPLGKGGMGEVFRARDTRLDRDVAIKMLPESMARDPDRVLRFEREAKLLASLNHPNIAHIYGFESSNNIRFLALEYIEGETLAARLKRGPLPIDETLEVCKHIAEALEAAHERGVIHRDLKPGNVMLTPDGTVKVLDFGLAKALADDPSGSMLADSPTITAEHTRPGIVLGTAAYMSPEQARGKPVDKRTDIWSFGVVLYECLAGQRPFKGETTSDLVAQILEREPDWTTLPPSTPPLIQLLLRRCLAKDKRRRLRDIGDATVDLETALADPTTTGLFLAHSVLAADSGWRWKRAALSAALLAVVAALAGAIGWSLRPPARAAPVPVHRYALDMPYSEVGSFCLNPAGTLLAFNAYKDNEWHIFLHDFSTGEDRPIAESGWRKRPFFSPDGKWIGFSVRDGLRKVSISGGPPAIVSDEGGRNAVWLDDGTIVYERQNAIYRFDETGGTEQRLLARAGPDVRTEDGAQLVVGIGDMEAVPGASYVLVSAGGGSTYEKNGIVSMSLTDGALRSVVLNAANARYVSPGYLIFLRESSLLAAPFDARRGVITGDAFPVVAGVRCGDRNYQGRFDVSLSGTLAYVPGGRAGPGRRLIRVTPAGQSESIMDTTDAISDTDIRVSPDGSDVALVTVRQQHELWSFNLDQRSLTLVNNVGEVYSPVWTPDGKALIFQLFDPESQIVRKRIGAPGAVEPIDTGRPMDLEDLEPSSISPDGKLLLLTNLTNGDVLLHHLGQNGATEVLLGTPKWEMFAMFAPDAEHYAYMSNEPGRMEVFVGSLSDRAFRRQVSRNGGLHPRWAHDGKHLYFIGHDNFMYRAPVNTDNGFDTLLPEALFDTTEFTTMPDQYDVFPNGDFVMIEPAEWEREPVRIQIVTNWASTLGKESPP